MERNGARAEEGEREKERKKERKTERERERERRGEERRGEERRERESVSVFASIGCRNGSPKNNGSESDPHPADRESNGSVADRGRGDAIWSGIWRPPAKAEGNTEDEAGKPLWTGCVSLGSLHRCLLCFSACPAAVTPSVVPGTLILDLWPRCSSSCLCWRRWRGLLGPRASLWPRSIFFSLSLPDTVRHAQPS